MAYDLSFGDRVLSWVVGYSQRFAVAIVAFVASVLGISVEGCAVGLNCFKLCLPIVSWSSRASLRFAELRRERWARMLRSGGSYH